VEGRIGTRINNTSRKEEKKIVKKIKKKKKKRQAKICIISQFPKRGFGDSRDRSLSFQ